ncbi:hypothetical protein M0812_10424 [Anaeramoeba flamelloides]|uniref:BZIP domain-containing protein n=1 Tax=Anaeramoeba flamelloides TaxID=1746091 RepID=A0AAV7ZRJ3_9EUKA|nr:hypothetical protein M0812_10424 [Anaeramoeba flamelloides]
MNINLINESQKYIQQNTTKHKPTTPKKLSKNTYIQEQTSNKSNNVSNLDDLNQTEGQIPNYLSNFMDLKTEKKKKKKTDCDKLETCMSSDQEIESFELGSDQFLVNTDNCVNNNNDNDNENENENDTDTDNENASVNGKTVKDFLYFKDYQVDENDYLFNKKEEQQFLNTITNEELKSFNENKPSNWKRKNECIVPQQKKNNNQKQYINELQSHIHCLKNENTYLEEELKERLVLRKKLKEQLKALNKRRKLTTCKNIVHREQEREIEILETSISWY